MRVVIAGGGIAGLTTAIVLTRRGIETSVFESAAADRPQGSGLMVSANALELFTRKAGVPYFYFVRPPAAL